MNPQELINPQLTDFAVEDLYIDSKINVVRHGLILDKPDFYYCGQKDPSVAFDPKNKLWHLYFTNTHSGQGCVGHLTSKNIEGKWQEEKPLDLGEFNRCGVEAPGVDFSNGRMHLYIQETHDSPNGNIYWGNSEDGYNFEMKGVALTSDEGTREAGIYDAAIKTINSVAYLLYSAFPFPYVDDDGNRFDGIHGDIALARSLEGSNYGSAWEKLGCIISHEDVPFHNQHDDPNREWGLEGGDLLELKDGSVLLIGVCFLKYAEPCHRQRIFVAHAKNMVGPFRIIGLLTNPCNDWGARENGHPCMVKQNGRIYIFTQVLTSDWRLGLLSVDEEELLNFLNN
jgi:hypothetical protein